jgi:hypothetical protein
MFPSSLRVCPSRVPVRQHHRRRLGASRAYRATPRDLSVNTFDLLPFVAPRPGGNFITPRQKRGAGAPHVPGGVLCVIVVGSQEHSGFGEVQVV